MGSEMCIRDSSSTGSISGYQWNFGDGFTSTTNNPSHNYVAEGTFTVELIATTALGCTDTVSGTVTIHPLPEADFTVTPACANSPVGILNSSSVVSGSIANSYWSVSYTHLTLPTSDLR